MYGGLNGRVKMIDFQQIRNRFEDYQIRCTALYPLFMMPINSMDEDLEESIYMEIHDLALDLGISNETLAKINNGDVFIGDVFNSIHKDGFIAEIETPVGNSWLHTSYKWFYGNSVEEIAKKAINWKLNKEYRYD